MSTLSSLNSPFLAPQPEPPKPSGFDYLTKLIVPVLALVALILTRSPRQSALTWALLAVAVIFLLAGFYSQFFGWVRRRLKTLSDKRTARRAFPELRNYIERFGSFVSRQKADTLHYIVQSEVCGNRSDILSQFNLPSADIFQSWWADLYTRAAGDKPSPASFKGTATQFGTLVALFNNHCMDAVFHRLPQDLKGKLADSSKSSLNLSQQRFNSFLEQYESFVGSLDKGFAERHVAIRSFSRVKPL